MHNVMNSLVHILRYLLSWIIAFVKWFFPTKLVVRQLVLKIHGLKEPVKIVHISDIHYDGPHSVIPRITPHFLDQTIEIANQQAPDLVVITGDFVEFAPEPAELLAKNWLSKLKPTYGVYAVLGNHDDKTPRSKSLIAQHLATSANIRVLENESVFPMGDKPGNLMLIGFGDFTHKHFQIGPVENSLSDISRPKLVLSHHPDSAELLRQYRADVILSGHTHGGQVLLPFLGTPLRYLSKINALLPYKIRKCMPFVNVLKNWDWIEGLHKVTRVGKVNSENPGVDVNYLFVNRGLATHPPLRFNCHPEIAVIELVPN